MTIRNNVPFKSYPVVSGDSLTFNSWFPLGKDHTIEFVEGDFLVRIWFDNTCSDIGKRDNSYFTTASNVCAERIWVDIEIRNLSTKLTEFIQKNVHNTIKDSPDLLQKSVEVGKQVFTICIKYLNRLIFYAKYVKGQYWMELFNSDTNYASDFFNEWESKASLDPGDSSSWFRWDPIHVSYGEIRFTDISTYIKSTEWDAIKDFLRKPSKVKFPLQLISNARLLTDLGYTRNAIVDIIIALETTFNEFIEYPNAEKLHMEYQVDRRVDIEKLNSSVGRIGFTNSINFLLPIILPEELADKELFDIVNKAITVRQNIVHNNQREVNSQECFKLINGVEQLAKILRSLTMDK